MSLRPIKIIGMNERISLIYDLTKEDPSFLDSM